MRGIELSPEQRARLNEKEAAANKHNRALAMMAHRQARLDRINVATVKAKNFLNTLDNMHQTNHIAAAMLYLGEGAKGEGAFCFANSDPNVIRYWLYLLRNSFDVDETKFRIQVVCRADQAYEELVAYWITITGIQKHIRGTIDIRTKGSPTKRQDYKGVCKIIYHDVSIRRYLDALAQGLMDQAWETLH